VALMDWNPNQFFKKLKNRVVGEQDLVIVRIQVTVFRSSSSLNRVRIVMVWDLKKVMRWRCRRWTGVGLSKMSHNSRLKSNRFIVNHELSERCSFVK